MSDQTQEFQEIITHLLQDSRFKTPIKTKSDYYEELKEMLYSYLEKLNAIATNGEIASWLKDNISDIQNSIDLLIRSLEEYLTGNVGSAYQKIDDYFNNKIISEFWVESVIPLNNYDLKHNTPKALYRVRQSATRLSKREEIFHVPFEKRYLVSNQRYSMAGIPCLYLGSSFFICWEELGRPSLNSLYISAFKTKNSPIKVLDLSFSLESIRNVGLDEFCGTGLSLNKIKAYISIFPLVQSCSFLRKNPDGRFNAEYVIPNLILQWVSSENSQVSGIKYRSTRVRDVKYCEHIHNFVFPPKRNRYQKEYFCNHLVDSFCLTAPYPFEVLDAIEYKEGINGCGSEIELESELKIEYDKTKFAEIERKILWKGSFQGVNAVT